MDKMILKLTIFFIFISANLYGYNLTVKVDNLRNSKGVVQVALYNKQNSIPDQDYTKYYQLKKGFILNNSSTVIFHNLKEGNYAVNILHDENKNGQVDKGMFLPTEGIGFSNFDTINIMNKPNFKKASFLLDKNKTVDIKVIYF